MTVLHATDPSSTFLQARARAPRLAPPPTSTRSCTRSGPCCGCWRCAARCSWRPSRTCPCIHAARPIAIGAGRAAADREDVRGGGDHPDPPALFAELEAVGLAAVRERGEATTAELTAARSAAVAAHRARPRANPTRRHQRLPEGVLPPRAGRPDRARAATRRLDGQPGPLEPHRALAPRRHPGAADRRGPGDALARWLRTFGPGTRDDLTWWTGWTVAAVKGGAGHDRRAGGDARRRRDRLRRCRTTRSRNPRRTLDRAAARARRDHDGLEGPRLVPGPAPAARCSTATAMPGRRSGWTAASWAAGASARAARSPCGCSRTWVRRRPARIGEEAARLEAWLGADAHPDQLPDADRDRAARLVGRPGQEPGGRGPGDRLPVGRVPAQGVEQLPDVRQQVAVPEAAEAPELIFMHTSWLMSSCPAPPAAASSMSRSVRSVSFGAWTQLRRFQTGMPKRSSSTMMPIAIASRWSVMSRRS